MKEVRTFNFINSIKGGCGKTTFSVFLAKYLGSKKDEIQTESCLIFDMDLQGTAMQHLFEGNNMTNIREGRYLNDAVRKSKNPYYYIKKNELIDGSIIETIFANPDAKEKAKYRISAQGGYSPVVKLNAFRDGLKDFLKKFEKLPYRHFIFDMPPNSDGFSEAAMECVLNRHHSVTENLDKINLFYVLGLDSGHMKATIDEIKNFLNGTDNKMFSNLFIIFNDNIIRYADETEAIKEFAGTENLWDIKLNKFKEEITGLTQKEQEKIYFAVMTDNIDYATWCIGGEGLCNAKKLDILPPPNIIKKFAKFSDRSFSDSRFESSIMENFFR